MAETIGTMDRVSITRVNKQMQAVTVFDSRIPAPQRLLLPGNLCLHKDPFIVPAYPDVSIFFPTTQFLKRWKAYRGVKLCAGRSPWLAHFEARYGKPEKHGGINQGHHSASCNSASRLRR